MGEKKNVKAKLTATEKIRKLKRELASSENARKAQRADIERLETQNRDLKKMLLEAGKVQEDFKTMAHERNEIINDKERDILHLTGQIEGLKAAVKCLNLK